MLFIFTGAILGMIAVVLAAADAHAANRFIITEYQTFFRVANHFHLLHAIMLVVVGVITTRIRNLWLILSGTLFAAGTLLFSGSLYLIAIADLLELSPLTPVGGAGLILAWLTLAIAAIAKKHRSRSEL